MKKFTRVLVTAICALSLVCVFALVGCSSEEESSSSSATEESSSSSSSSSSEESSSSSASSEESSSSSASSEASSSESSEANEDVELQIYAANSLSKALDAVQELYTEQTGVTFADTQYEASGTLVEMLDAGGYADLLITASESTMDDAIEGGHVEQGSSDDLFTNELVMVTGEDSEYTDVKFDDLTSGEYSLAVGDDNVPAGNYAKQSLSTLNPPCWISSDGTTGSESTGKEGTFDGTPLEGKVVEGSSVGNVCEYASSGEVDIAMVYSSDVYRIGGVKIVDTVPDDTHKPIVYPGAVVTQSKYIDGPAEEFLLWMVTDDDAIKIWQEWGFEIAK